MPELVFYRRGEEVLRVGLGRPRLVLGRGEDCDVVIPDPHVSRQQVALILDGPRCRVEDLSGQGTEVAGKPMKQGELPDGADLKLGPWRAVFRQSSSAGSSSPTRTGRRTDVQSHEPLEDGPPPAQVRVKQGTTELLYPVTADSFTVGKDSANALVVRDRFISSQHLHVTRREACFHVRDLNSTNGTYLEGVRLFEAEIPLNTVLRVGETELLFEPASQGQQEPSFHGLVGNDPAMRQLVELIRRVAPSNAVVTVLGESGTGKELVARALHEASPRAGQPFVPINCGALSPAVIESELFGHEKGAFTGAEARRKGAFEEAQGGTLFLDEVGELPLELQTRLLRVLDGDDSRDPRDFDRGQRDRPGHCDASNPCQFEALPCQTNRSLADRWPAFPGDCFHTVARFTRKFLIPKGFHTIRNKKMRAEKLFFSFETAQRTLLDLVVTPGNGRLARVASKMLSALRARCRALVRVVLDAGAAHNHREWLELADKLQHQVLLVRAPRRSAYLKRWKALPEHLFTSYEEPGRYKGAPPKRIHVAETTTPLRVDKGSAVRHVRTLIAREEKRRGKLRWHALFVFRDNATDALSLIQEFRARQHHEQTYRILLHDAFVDTVPSGYFKKSPNPDRPGFRKNAITLYSWLAGLAVNALRSLTAALPPQFQLAHPRTLRRWWLHFPAELYLSDKALFVILRPRWFRSWWQQHILLLNAKKIRIPWLRDRLVIYSLDALPGAETPSDPAGAS